MKEQNATRRLGRRIARAVAIEDYEQGTVVGRRHIYRWLVEPWTAVCIENSVPSDEEWDDSQFINSLVEEGHDEVAKEFLSQAGPGAELVVSEILNRSQFGLSVIVVRVPREPP